MRKSVDRLVRILDLGQIKERMYLCVKGNSRMCESRLWSQHAFATGNEQGFAEQDQNEKCDEHSDDLIAATAP
jgi:hypothetical protein